MIDPDFATDPRYFEFPDATAALDITDRIESAADLAGTPADEIRWDIEDLLPADDAPALWFGPPGSLKSWIAAHFCHCAVTGQRFLGRFLVRKRPRALFVNLDAGEKSLRNRIRRVSAAHGFDFITLGAADLSLTVLRKLVEQYRDGIVVIDCWSAIYAPDRNLDPSHAMREFVDQLRGIYAEFNVGGAVIDHPHRPKEKGEEGDFYGNIQKLAAFRTMWGIVADAPIADQPRTAKISCRKMSEGEMFATVSLSVDFSGDRVRFTVADAAGESVVRLSALESRIIEWCGLRTEAFSKRTIADSIRGYRIVDVRAAVESLIQAGRLVTTGAKRGGGDLYRLECVPECVPSGESPIGKPYRDSLTDFGPHLGASAASGCVPRTDAPGLPMSSQSSDVVPAPDDIEIEPGVFD